MTRLKLSTKQTKAVDAMRSGRNVLLKGARGKSAAITAFLADIQENITCEAQITADLHLIDTGKSNLIICHDAGFDLDAFIDRVNMCELLRMQIVWVAPDAFVPPLVFKFVEVAIDDV